LGGGSTLPSYSI